MKKLLARFKNLNLKEVKKMKKLIMIAAILAIGFAFLPRAEAGDTAELGLSVTFALEPLKIWTEPAGPFTVQELDTLEFKVIAEDLDSLNVNLKAESLPEGAEFIIGVRPITINHREGTFKWTPKIGQGSGSDDPSHPTPYIAVFKAKNEEGEEVKLDVRIDVTPAPVISIEITPNKIDLGKVKLGEMKSVTPSPEIRNTGNVPILVNIGYGALIAHGPQPGLEQGLDRFITVISNFIGDHQVLPPDQRLKLGGIRVGGGLTLLMDYGAPTALSDKTASMSVAYELRAYPGKDLPPGDKIVLKK